MLSSKGSSRPRDRTHICTAGGFFTVEPLLSLPSYFTDHFPAPPVDQANADTLRSGKRPLITEWKVFQR